MTPFPYTLLENCSDLTPVYFIPLLLYQILFKHFLYNNKVCSKLNSLSNGIKKYIFGRVVCRTWKEEKGIEDFSVFFLLEVTSIVRL